MRRNIIKIDEDKCNGCGACVLGCHEGALKIVDGKARLINETYCDGLGACIGECPQGAISIEEKEAAPFNEEKVKEKDNRCPGSKVINLQMTKRDKADECCTDSSSSDLTNWPIQLMLVPAIAPFLDDSDIVVAADCVPFAYADFHKDFLKGRVLLVGCPKLDNIGRYEEKFRQIFKNNNVKSITYIHMEVPCCLGMIKPIKLAIEDSGKDIPFKEITINIKGDKVS